MKSKVWKILLVVGGVAVLWYLWRQFSASNQAAAASNIDTSGATYTPTNTVPTTTGAPAILPPAPATSTMGFQQLFANKRIAAFGTPSGGIKVISYGKKGGVTVTDA